MPRHDKVKINGANGQTGGKNRSSTFVHSFSLACLIFFIFHMYWPVSGNVLTAGSAY